MPYFYNNEINLLFIHIPKTGGTSVEKYFENKYKIELDKDSLYTTEPKDFFNEISYQHQTIKTLENNKKIFRIDYYDIEILSIVRNPYNRLVSDLFFKNLIKESSTVENVNDVIKEYISDAYNTTHDNHRIPQHMFLIDENNQLRKNIKVLKNESLTDEMVNVHGYHDFNNYDQVSHVRNKNYFSYLNYESVKLINDFYDKDFTYFGYDKITSRKVLNYYVILDEIKVSSKIMNNYISNFLDCENDNIREEDLTNQTKHILFLTNQKHEEKLKKIQKMQLEK